MLLAVAGLAMAGELINKMANKPKSVDRSGYLANLIYELIEGAATLSRQTHKDAAGVEWRVCKLSGGASMWWDRSGRRLMAMRINHKLQGGEADTFTVNIHKAGYSTKGPYPVFIEADLLNSWHGVVWIIGAGVVDTAEDPAEPVQGLLF